MLTIKKEAFANEYVANGGNASAAYRHAYNTHAAPHTIAVEASRLLTDPDGPRYLQSPGVGSCFRIDYPAR